MTAAQLHDARMLIPCAFELNAPPHRASRAGSPVPAAPVQDARRPGPAVAETPYVVAAPFPAHDRPGARAAILATSR
jgi:hypothetical protein